MTLPSQIVPAARGRGISMLLVACCTIAGFLTSCSSSERGSSETALVEPERTFSAEEKRAARALSVSLATAQTQLTADPVERFAQCRAAVASLRGGLGNSGVFNETQVQALSQIEQQLEQRARSAAIQSGVSTADVDAALQRAMGSMPAIADAAPMALTCARMMEAGA